MKTYTLKKNSVFERMSPIIAYKAAKTKNDLSHRLLNILISLRLRKNSANYFSYIGESPNYAQPKNWSEKMQWRKAFDRNPLFQVFCDKYAVRDYVKSKTSDLHFSEFLWVGDSSNKIPFEELTVPFVIKPNHGSGKIIKVKDPRNINKKDIVAQCKNWAKKPHGVSVGEWGYKGIKGKILVEEYLGSLDDPLTTIDYKFFVFDGKVGFVQTISEKDQQKMYSMFSPAGERLPFKKWLAYAKEESMNIYGSPEITLPDNFEKMCTIAEAIGQDIDHIRVDLYSVDDKVYLSELTPYSSSGYEYFYHIDENFDTRPTPVDDNFGSHWKLPDIPLSTMYWRALFG